MSTMQGAAVREKQVACCWVRKKRPLGFWDSLGSVLDWVVVQLSFEEWMRVKEA